MKTRFLLTVITLATLTGCTTTYTVTLTDAQGTPLPDRLVTLGMGTGYGFLDIRHAIVGCFTYPTETTNAEGQAIFELDREWGVHDVTVDEQWILGPNHQWSADAQPMWVGEEYRDVASPDDLPPLPDRPWIQFDPRRDP